MKFRPIKWPTSRRLRLGSVLTSNANLNIDSSGADGYSAHRRKPLGLRARVIAAFTLGAFLLSVFLSFSTYIAVRHTLVQQREELAERQSFVNARLVRAGLRTTKVDVPRLLGSLEIPPDSETLLLFQGRPYSTDSIHVNQATVPDALLKKVESGSPAIMRVSVDGNPLLIVGIPIPAVSANYFEITTLADLERTLRILALTLVVASTVTTLGGALLGRRATRSVLLPVTKAASAAEAIAAGDLETRLSQDGDQDLDRLVISFNRMVDALHGRIERDARFASDVSHELRSPLMTLSSGLSVLQSRRDELPPRSQTALDLLTDEVQRFQRMVQDLLEISRSDAGHVDVSYDEVRVGEFVQHAIERYEQAIPVEAEAGVGEVVLSVDKRRLERVIGNLIENADRYAGGVTRIGIVWAGKSIRILVEDSGPGVPENERERIFERFARGETARARASGEGTGLGLSLVSEHVKLHGGRVWVEDKEGGGSRFVVELPRADR